MKRSTLLWALLPAALALGCSSSAPPVGTPVAEGAAGTMDWDGGASIPMAPPPAGFADDSVVARIIRQTLDQDARLAPASRNLSVAVNKGEVTLSGTVPSEADRTAILTRLSKLPGVDRIEAQGLSVAP